MKVGSWRTIQLGCAAWVFLFQACSAPQMGGSISALTYNVSGLVQGISLTDSEKNIPLIAPLLNHHDLVLVQEDFHYHERLSGPSEHPYRSYPKRPDKLVSDGLNRFSRSPFGELVRRSWSACNGYLDSRHDCLSDKGFSFAEHWLSPSVSVHVYNLHMDAGRSQEDYRARARQIEQLLRAIERHSHGRALIVAGDTN